MMTIGKTIGPALGAVALALTGWAETATVRIGYPQGAKGVRYETRTVELERAGGASWRFVMPKAEIPKDAKCVEVVPSFMTARKGDDGYWMQARGTYGLFDKDDGSYVRAAQLMPVFGVKKGASLWYAHVKTWRFNYAFVTTAKKGAYETFPRFDCAMVRRFFPEYYDDIVVDFHRLDGAEADYNGLAHAYRKYQLDRGAVRTIKDRLNPELDYLCDTIVVRIQTHAAKPIPLTSDGITKKFFKVGEELPIAVHMPFGVTEEFLQALKDSGIDKLSICSAGWQDGGYDGRAPGHFPVCAEAGGAKAFDRLVAKAKSLGYQFALHATNTDGYMCSRLWDEDWVCKCADGTLYKGGLWAGGQCFWVCQKCAWERWLPEEMRKMAALGIRGPHYIDVYSATYPKPCGDPKHPCTWEQTAEYQNRILAYGKELMGCAASESGYDHVAGNIDYINYIERDLKYEHEGKLPALATGVFPLWELVYHGIILYTSDRLTQNHTRGKCLYKLETSGDPRWMEGDGVEDPYVALKIIEFGGRPIFYTYKFADVPRIKRAWDEFVPVRHLQREQMTEHRTLAPGVFLTAYGDGSKTVCNYTDKTYVHGGTPVRSMGYVLVRPDGSVFDGYEPGFTPIFNGRDLDGWIGAKHLYYVENGELVFKEGPKNFGNLFYQRPFTNFVARFSFKLVPNGNNGFAVRAGRECVDGGALVGGNKVMSDAAYNGMEIQVLDDTGDKKQHLKAWQYHGSIYGVVTAQKGALRPVGEWNDEEVTVDGENVTVILNGKTILATSVKDLPTDGTTPDGKPHPGLHNPSGYIGFLGHTMPVRFRNIRVKELP